MDKTTRRAFLTPPRGSGQLKIPITCIGRGWTRPTETHARLVWVQLGRFPTSRCIRFRSSGGAYDALFAGVKIRHPKDGFRHKTSISGVSKGPLGRIPPRLGCLLGFRSRPFRSRGGAPRSAMRGLGVFFSVQRPISTSDRASRPLEGRFPTWPTDFDRL